MEMIIDSEGREIKLLIEYLKGTVCIACRSYYKEVFLNLEEIFSQILEPAKQKWHLHNYAFKLGHVSNMNLVYGLAFDEFSVAEVDNG